MIFFFNRSLIKSLNKDHANHFTLFLFREQNTLTLYSKKKTRVFEKFFDIKSRNQKFLFL